MTMPDPHIFEDPAKIERVWLGSDNAFTVQPGYNTADHHLFRSLKGIKFSSMQECEEYLVQYFAKTSRKFFGYGIMMT